MSIMPNLSNDARARLGWRIWGPAMKRHLSKCDVHLLAWVAIIVPCARTHEDEGDGSCWRKELIISRYGPDCLHNGARQLVQHLQQLTARLIVAKLGYSQEMEILLEAAQADDLLDEITTSSDAEASKPSPDMKQHLALNMQPDQVWWHTLWYPSRQCGWSHDCCSCGGFDDADLKREPAIYDDPLICWLTTPIRRSAKPHKNRGVATETTKPAATVLNLLRCERVLRWASMATLTELNICSKLKCSKDLLTPNA